MPRAAVLSIHARVDGTGPATWEDPSLVQLWGPRYSAYVVAARDLAVFSLGRLPDDERSRQRAEGLACRLHELLDGGRMTYGRAGRALGEPPNRLRYAAATGTVLIRWEGARQPIVWTVPKPDVAPRDARLELARRYLHIFGPGTPEAFSGWAGIPRPGGPRGVRGACRRADPGENPGRRARGSSHATNQGCVPPRGPWRPPACSRAATPTSSSRVPIGSFWSPTQIIVGELWTPRVWPGALLVEGEVVGTWRRAQERVTIQTWRRLSRSGARGGRGGSGLTAAPRGPGAPRRPLGRLTGLRRRLRRQPHKSTWGSPAIPSASFNSAQW